MPIQLNDLKSRLECSAGKIFTDGQETLLYPFCHRGQMLQVIVEILEDGEYIRFYIPCLLDISAAPVRENVLVRLLDINRRIKMLKFCYDPSDGEVSVSIEIPLEDATFTERQAQRCLFVLTSIALRERDNLCTLMATGVYPDSSDPEFTDAIGRLLGTDEDVEIAEETDIDGLAES